MILLIKIIENMNKYLVTPEAILTTYFTVLALLVTLISITSVLTKEIRQDLIIRYYFKTKLIIWYFSFLVGSFLVIIISNNCEHHSTFSLIIFIILFGWTIGFIITFIKSLTRGKFYSALFEKFKKESRRDQPKSKELLPRSHNQFQTLNDFTKNIGFIQKNSSDFIDETEFLKKVILFCIENNKVHIIQDFFNDRDAFRINNLKYFENLISLFYDLRFFNKDVSPPELMTLYQYLMFKVIEQSFYSVKIFSFQLNTSGLYIKEFLDIRFIEQYKRTTDKEWIQKYQQLINQTIDLLFTLSKNILNSNIPNEYKQKYLISMLGELNKSLEHYTHIYEGDFCKEDYYKLKFDEKKNPKEKELLNTADEKYNFIKSRLKHLQEKLSELFYLILYKIDSGELNISYFKIAIQLYNTKALKSQFNKKESFDKLNFVNYNWFEGGAQSIGSFNFNKYRLLFIFYEYIYSREKEKTVVDILNSFEKEVFTERNTLNSEIENLKMEFIQKYFNEFNKKDFNEFKRIIQKNTAKRIKYFKDEETKYYAENHPKKEYVEQFINDCKVNWDLNQKDLLNFIDVRVVKGGTKLKTCFTQYLLEHKREFLDSFDKTVGLSRDLGSMFIQRQIISKNSKIIVEISNLFSINRGDKEIIVKDLIKDISKEIKPKKEYYLFYAFDDLKLYEISGIEWAR